MLLAALEVASTSKVAHPEACWKVLILLCRLCVCLLHDVQGLHGWRPLTSMHLSLQGGNDYEIYESPRTIGHAVTSPFDTISQCRKLFMEPSDIA